MEAVMEAVMEAAMEVAEEVDTEAAVAATVVVVNQDMEAVEVVCSNKGQTLDSSKTYLQMQDHLPLTSHDQGCSQAACLQVECHQVCVQAANSQVAVVHHKECDQEVHLQEACVHQVVFHLEGDLLLAVLAISLATLSASEIVYSFL